MNFGPKITKGQSLVKIKLLLAEIYHYNETRTNVAWSYAPRHVPNNTDDITLKVLISDIRDMAEFGFINYKDPKKTSTFNS